MTILIEQMDWLTNPSTIVTMLFSWVRRESEPGSGFQALILLAGACALPRRHLSCFLDFSGPSSCSILYTFISIQLGDEYGGVKLAYPPIGWSRLSLVHVAVDIIQKEIL